MWLDGQAREFDDHAGLEPLAGQAIVRSVLQRSGIVSDDIILDVGAGTGALGVHFATRACHYVGLDFSRRMLEVFRQKLAAYPDHVLLLQADVELPWSIRDGAVALVFASRVVHHLKVGHFVDEVFRVCRPGGYLLLGRVRREPDSLPSRLQGMKRGLLAEHGSQAPAVGQAVRQVVDECAARGAAVLNAVTAAQWTRTATPRQLLTAWEGKPQLDSRAGGGKLGAGARAAVVKALRDRALSEFGDLDREQEFNEEYSLDGVRLP